ncbi:MAG TPA: hypothetical protein PK156_40540, partial [Polyangium sp.]|nr:hypothetical protein [Polyangium sp.]
MDDDIHGKIAIAGRRSLIPDVHLHPTRTAVRRRTEIGVVEPASVLGVGIHLIVATQRPSVDVLT